MQGGSGWNHDVHHELLLCMLPSESERRGDKMIGSHKRLFPLLSESALRGLRSLTGSTKRW
jgi:hypothetical protein